jgi:hypothetical protein
MLMAAHGAFYKSASIQDGTVHPSDPYGTLRFFQFPTRPQTLHLVLSLYLTAEARGTLSYRMRRGVDEQYRGQPVEVHFPDPGVARQFDYLYEVRDVVFRREGSYAVDVMLDGHVLYTAELAVVQIK